MLMYSMLSDGNCIANGHFHYFTFLFLDDHFFLFLRCRRWHRRCRSRRLLPFLRALNRLPFSQRLHLFRLDAFVMFRERDERRTFFGSFMEKNGKNWLVSPPVPNAIDESGRAEIKMPKWKTFKDEKVKQ